MSNDLEWAITVGKLVANVDHNNRHILRTAMRRHPDAPWPVAISGLYAQGYSLEWALNEFVQSRF